MGLEIQKSCVIDTFKAVLYISHGKLLRAFLTAEELAMFDGILPNESNPGVILLDRVIASLPNQSAWIKGQLKSDNRRCLQQVLSDVDGSETLTEPILEAAQQVTGKYFSSIPTFNDAEDTTFDVMTTVLQRTRDNLISAAALTWITAGTARATPAGRSTSRALATVAASALFIIALVTKSA